MQTDRRQGGSRTVSRLLHAWGSYKHVEDLLSTADDTTLVLAIRRDGELHTLAERSEPARATISGRVADE